MSHATHALQGFTLKTPEEVQGNPQVPAKVRRKVSRFFECDTCLKVFWEGPKFESTREKFAAFVTPTAAGTPEPP